MARIKQPKDLARVDPIVHQAIQESPVQIALEQGKRHIKIMMDGQQVTIMPATKPSENRRRASLNVRAAIRRASELIMSGETLSSMQPGAVSGNG